jgi:alpha-2-macroglobulin
MQIDRHLLLKLTWSSRTKLAMRALALYVAHKMLVASKVAPTHKHWGELHDRAASLWRKNSKKMDVETAAWCLKVLGETEKATTKTETKTDKLRRDLLRFFMDHVHETADAAEFRICGSDLGDADAEQVILRSDTRCDAAILEALIFAAPDSPLIPKLAAGLSRRRSIRRAGRYCCSAWGNTQDNSWVLLALDAYFNEFEKADPDYVAKVWFGDQFAGAVKFHGRTTDRFTVPIPMKHVVASLGEADESSGSNSVVVLKDGEAGRCYYRLALTYAPRSLEFSPRNFGMQLRREYSHVDHPGDVRLVVDCDDAAVDRTSAGKKARQLRRRQGVQVGERRRWQVKLGSRVRVTLTVTNSFDNYHVALVDKLPSGFEPLNPALNAQVGMDHARETAPSDSSAWWGYSRWFDHQNLRDERAEAFTELLWPGVHTYQFVCRATCAGNFIAPPARVEEMYSPDVNGRTATEYVDIS